MTSTSDAAIMASLAELNAAALDPSAVDAGDATGAKAPRDYALLLPADWTRISLDERADQHVVRLVGRYAERFPAREREGMRSAVTGSLIRAVDAARDAGGVDLLIWVGSDRGAPVSATCLVLALAQGSSQLAGYLEDMVRGESETTMTVVGGGSAVRRRRRTRVALDEAVLGDLTVAEELGGAQLAEQVRRAAAATPPTETALDFFVRVPETDTMLLFAFSTPIATLADPMERLFDAIMGGLRWVR